VNIANLYLWRTHLPELVEGIFNFMSKRGWKKMEGTDFSKAECEVIIAPDGEDWTAIFVSPLNMLSNLAQSLTFETDQSGLVLEMDIPTSWKFLVLKGGDVITQYSWEIPAEILEKQTDVASLEIKKLRSLGITLSESKHAKKKGSCSRSDQHIASSDPHVELSYRKKISNGLLVPPDPEMSPELPKLLSVCFPDLSVSRFRKILSKPHLTIENMIAEFTNYLGINRVFRRFEDIRNDPEIKRCGSHWRYFSFM
ncbi:hypothetical protein JW979_12115, partial [bacterium]|nr:hypothetical protein [candidate division CSSED10-310 bacterium]